MTREYGRSRFWWARSGLATFLLLAGLAGVPASRVSWAQSEQTNAADSPALPPGDLRFRRFYVLESQISEQARRYLPMKREQFERLLRNSMSQQAWGGSALRARLSESELTARMNLDGVLMGTGRWVIAGEEPGGIVLPLDPLNLAIRMAVWEANQQEADLASDAQERMGLVVNQTGTLRFDWSLRGTRSVLGDIEFSMEMPLAVISRLLLDLPADLQPTVDAGVVTRIGPSPVIPDDVSTPSPAETVGAGMVRWHIEFGGQSRLKLRLSPPAELRPPGRLAFLRQSSRYAISQVGIECRSKLSLDVYEEPLRRLSMVIPQPMQLAAVYFGDQLLTPVVRNARANQPLEVEVEFPQPLLGVRRELQVVSLMPLPRDTSFSLPIIQVPQLNWQQGTVVLDVGGDLLLSHLKVEQGQELSVRPLPGPVYGESRQLQLYQPDAALELRVDPVAVSVQGTMGTTVTIGPTTMMGRVVAQLAAHAGSPFQIDGALADLWQIDSVETLPAEALESWALVQQDARRLVRLNLRRPIDAENPLRVRLVAHRATPRNGLLRSEQLRIWTLQGGAETRRWTCLNQEGPYQLRFEGDFGLPRIDPSKLPAEDQELISSTPVSLVYQDESSRSSFSIVLNRERPAFTATSTVRVDVGRGRLTQTATLRCQPESAPLQRLLVRFSEPDQGRVQWSVVGEGTSVLTARRLDPEERRRAGLGEGDGWEINFRQPRATLFELQAEQTADLRERRAVSLVSAPEASSQSGVLQIRCPDGAPLSVDAGDLPVLPASSDSPAEFSSVRAAFRYNPSQDVHVFLTPSTAPAAFPTAWAASSHLIGHLAANGIVQYQVQWNLENSGRNRVSIHLPAACDIQAILVNHQPVGWQMTGESPSTVWFPLPPGNRFPQIVLRYTAPLTPLEWLTKVEINRPEIDLPCLFSLSELWVPPGIAVWEPSPDRDARGSEIHFRRPRIFDTQRTSPPWPWEIDAWWPTRDRHHQDPDPQDIEFLRQCADVLLTDKFFEDVTWGQWLERVAQQLEVTTGKTLLVDVAAYRDRGIRPNDERIEESLAAGSEKTQFSTGGVFLITPDSVICSTSAAVGGAGIELRSVGDADWWWSCHASDEAVAELIGSPPSSWMNTAQWSSAPAWPWPRAAELPTMGEGDYREWVRYRFSPIRTARTTQAVALWIYPQSSMVALGWAVFLLSAGLFAWLAGWSPFLVLPVMVASGVASCLAPDLAVPTLRAVFWGSLAALALHWIRGRLRTFSTPVSVRAESSGSVRAAVLSVLVLTGVSAAATASAQEPAARPSTDTDRGDLKVLIPVDEESREPVGEYLYAPRRLYDALYRMDQRAAADRPAWTIFSANYECTLEPSEPGEGAVLREVTATFDIEVTRADTAVRLPLLQAEANVWRATWGEEVLALDSQDEERQVVLRPPRPGRASLVLQLRPAFRVESGHGEMSLTIPRVPLARLAIAAPPVVTPITVPTAQGRVDRDATRGTVHAELGPASRLTIHWASPVGAAMPSADFRAEQLLWLQVQPNAVVLEVRLRVLGPLEQLKPVRLVTDGRLRWLPTDQPGVSVLRQVRNGDELHLDLALRNLEEDEAEIFLTFLVMGASGVGRVSLPPLEIQGVRTTRRWVGVTVAPSLSFQQTEGAELLTPGEFTDSWGETETPPQVAFRLGSSNSHWGVTTRPLEPQVSVRHHHEVRLSADELNLSCLANYQIADAPVFRLAIAAPPALQVRNVWLLTTEGATPSRQPVRWARDTAGVIEVSLAAGLQGAVRLEIQGSLRIPSRQPLEVPFLTAVGTEGRGHTLKMTRRLDVRADVESVTGLAAVSEPGGERPSEEAVRFVGSWESVGEPPLSPAMRLQISVNRPRVEGWCTTELSHEAMGWWTSLDTRFEIRNGSLDVLRFDIPAAWREPYEITPSARWALVAGTDPERRQLIVYPQTPLAGTCRITIRAPVQSTAAEPFAVPNIVPLDVGSLPRFYVLPATWEEQELGWETSGLLESTLPAAAVGNAPAGKVYQVVGPRPKAVVNAVKRTSGVPRISLADVRVALDAHGAFNGLTTLDIEPEGRRNVILEVPANVELLYAAVEEVPARMEREDSQRWQLALGPAQLPQRLTFTFRGQLALARQSNELVSIPTPWIRDLDAETTLWTVYTPASDRTWSLSEPGQVAPRDLAIARLAHLERLTQKPPGFVAEDERLAWWRPWGHRLELSRAELEYWQKASHSPSDMGETSTPGTEADTERTPDLATGWSLTASENSHSTCWQQPGAKTFLSVYPTRSSWSRNRGITAITVGVLMGLGIFLLLVGLRWTWWDIGLASPTTLGVLLGIGWWLFATPSGWGWLLVICVLVRSGWPVWWKPRLPGTR